MSGQREQLEAALRLVEARWSENRADATHHGLERRRRRRRVTRTVAAVAVVTGVLGSLLWAWPKGAAEPQLAVTPPAVAPLRFSVESVGATQAVLAQGSLTRGRVLMRGEGVLRVGQLEVAVLAGRVLVEHVDDSAVIQVEEGRAVVRWSGQEVSLEPGEVRTFSTAEEGPEPEATDDARPPRAPRAPVKWKQLAERGDFNAAYVALRAAKHPLRDEPEELLLAADVARLSRHPQEAVAPLRRLLERHPRDSRAALAAFTLGRTLLDELGQPAEGAVAFASARVLSPLGPLADDALAREVEAQSRAGETEKARVLAQQYLRRLPDGPRAKHVRHYGGIE